MIIENDADYITVEFVSKTYKLVYPDVFTKFIKMEGSAIQAFILKEIKNAKVVVKEKNT
jgi:hypothetical protein